MYKYEVGRGHKTGIYLNCPQCSKSFYIIKSRIKKSEKHYCSLQCLSRYTAKQRSEKLRKKNYPLVIGTCILCRKDITAKNAGFDKPNRKFCSNHCKNSFNNSRRIWKQESKKKIGKANRGRERTLKQRMEMSERVRGEKASNWQGGITSINKAIRNSLKYKLWRESVFKRDNYQCTLGKKEHGNKLQADHIKPFAYFPELRFALSNGRTLCKPCHTKTNTWGGSYRRRDILEILNKK